MMKKVLSLAAVGATLGAAATVNAAEPCYMSLRANGADIQPDSTMKQPKGIECVAFDNEVDVAGAVGTGMATARRVYKGIKCTKKVDKTSPLIFKALVSNQLVDASFKFYRSSPDGREDQFLTITIKSARVSNIRQTVVNGNLMEDVVFVFPNIHVQSGAVIVDDVVR
jgi:type VI secretion system Hcp family effector